MPFYFQDLRTNEIVAFHAFLDDLSDSYSAEYNSTSGYGRIEDIKMYKSTKRSVGCTFHVISTNPEDFEYMWWQINKLTTMVYPQWSQGRAISTKLNDVDFKFTQPFSQIPTSTPVIRLRVGDLIRSNYSRFNLKRLFGYKDADKAQTSGATTTKYYVEAGAWVTPDGTKNLQIKKEAELGTNEPKFLPFSESKSASQQLKFFSSELGELVYVDDRYVKSRPFEVAENKNVEDFYNEGNNSIIKSFESFTSP
jgi:hypothetical protein